MVCSSIVLTVLCFLKHSPPILVEFWSDRVNILSQSPQVSPWSYKPWWCQPWSILLTGIAIITGSWFLAHTVWFTGLVAVPILAWMGFFLLVWPQLMIRSGMLEPDQTAPESAIAEE